MLLHIKLMNKKMKKRKIQNKMINQSNNVLINNKHNKKEVEVVLNEFSLFNNVTLKWIFLKCLT